MAARSSAYLLKRSATFAVALATSATPPSALVVSAFAPCRQHRSCRACALPLTIRPGTKCPLRSPLPLRRLCAVTAAAEKDDDVFSSSDSSTSTSGSSAVRSVRRTDPPPLPYFQMVSFYRFAPLSDPASVRDALFEELVQIDGLRGSAYLATEGINAQFAIPTQNVEMVGRSVEQFTAAVRRGMPFDPFEINAINYGDIVDSTLPTFNRLVVRTRDAILRSGLERSDDGTGGDDAEVPVTTFDWDGAGMELTPEEWDADLRKSSSGILLDCRNSYESEVGTFAGADPLGTDVFSESWDILKEKTKDLDKADPIRIYCTGGIRCVKVGAYLKQELGFEDVRRLEHGIIGYERWVTEAGKEANSDRTKGDESAASKDSLWEGENFLFDKRRLDDEKSSQ